jgi:hypothetical protein
MIFDLAKAAEQAQPRDAAPTSSAVGGAVAVAPPAKQPERRSQKRIAVRMAARVRLGDLRSDDFEEVTETVNSSRGGLYFIGSKGRYRPGMSLRVTFPYHSNHDNVSASEECAEVKRLDAISDNRLGVAVQFHGAADSPRLGSSSSSASRPGSERRANKRHPFSAAATAVQLDTGMRMQARCSDLNMDGCYVDTLNPFAAGSSVSLQLLRLGSVFETSAMVISSHPGMGMGLAFLEPSAKQKEMLANWLDGEEVRNVLVASPQMPPAQPAGSDRDLLISLICLLQSKGTITQTDVVSLLSNLSV